jgi:hypothetical protein
MGRVGTRDASAVHPAVTVSATADVTVTVRAMGSRVPIVISARDEERARSAAARLVAAWSRCDPREPGATLDDAGPPIRLDLEELDEDAGLAWISTAVTTRTIDGAAPDHLLLHAAACADDATGLAACFVGPSGRGKTTASIALGGEFGYLTDEAAVIDARGRVLPYPKPLSLATRGAVVKAQRSPDALGLRRAPDRPWPLGALFLLDRVETADVVDPAAAQAVRVDPVGLPEAILALAPELSSLDRLDGPLQRLASLVDLVGPALRLRYAEAASLPPSVRRILAERAAARVDAPRRPLVWRALDVAPPAADRPAPAGSFRRVAAIDAIEAAGTLVVLSGGAVIAAGGLAPAIWERTSEWTTVADLRGELVADLGEPDDAGSRVHHALEAMRAAGLLERSSP